MKNTRPNIPNTDVEPPEFTPRIMPKPKSINTKLNTIIGFALILLICVVLFFAKKIFYAAFDCAWNIVNGITTPKAILIGSIIIAYNLRPKMHKLHVTTQKGE